MDVCIIDAIVQTSMVRPYVCLQRACTVHTHRTLPWVYLHHLVGQGSGSVLRENICNRFPKGWYVEEDGMKNRNFRPISLYLGNCTVQDSHNYNGRRIGTRQSAPYDLHFQWPWTTRNPDFKRHANIRRWISQKRYKTETLLQWYVVRGISNHSIFSLQWSRVAHT